MTTAYWIYNNLAIEVKSVSVDYLTTEDQWGGYDALIQVAPNFDLSPYMTDLVNLKNTIIHGITLYDSTGQDKSVVWQNNHDFKIISIIERANFGVDPSIMPDEKTIGLKLC